MTATTQEELERKGFQMRLRGTDASCCNNSVNAHNIEEAYIIRNLYNLITYQIIVFNSVNSLAVTFYRTLKFNHLFSTLESKRYCYLCTRHEGMWGEGGAGLRVTPHIYPPN